ncbi:hypothetical protein [Microbacterium invictum]|uniref:TrbL/VirB6 plasmid conjugal transfer protein n=1 Tax=Microbacterium invictum TaxID=515415 RepID=A0AA40SQX5_9MICO|nr:hypothetical protein [Microbacterium invictum]MBB4140785.1 hypothetical protein [Microbacterium invictum]
MRTVRALIIGTVVGILAGVGALTPALAAEPVPMAVEVSGESWSGPAFPVNCRESGGQVTCTPDDAAQISAQKCFRWVIYGDENTTVCTTFAGHENAVRSAGGREAIVAYGCSLGDVVCMTFENAGRGMALGATAMMFTVAENMRFDTTTALWDAATGEWSFWAWAVLIVLFVSMVWAITSAVVSGDRSELVGAIVRSFIAVPAISLTLWLIGHVLNAIDDLTWYILGRDGVVTLFATLQKVTWAGGEANYFFAFIIHGLLMVAMLLLMLVFAFRNIVLAALIMVGPIAWMVFPVRGIGPQWVVRYVSAVVVLLLTGPLTIGFVTLIINGLAGVQTIWDPQSWPLLVGLVLVAFAPFAIFGLFSFVGGVAADSIGSAAASHAGGMVSRGAHTAISIPSRVGATPAGMGASQSGGTARATSAASRTGAASSVRGASTPVRTSTARSSTSTTAPPSSSSRTPAASAPPASAPAAAGGRNES